MADDAKENTKNEEAEAVDAPAAAEDNAAEATESTEAESSAVAESVPAAPESEQAAAPDAHAQKAADTVGHGDDGHGDDGDHHEDHGTGWYIKLWVWLLILLVISVLGPELEIKVVTLVTAFGIAVVKAYMVCAYYMHLNVEKRIVWYILASVSLFMLVLFAGFAPDIMAHQGSNWYKKATEEQIPANRAAAAHHGDHGDHGDHDGGHDDHGEAGHDDHGKDGHDGDGHDHDKKH
jgi:caa(3)-type oxidase subunit IV